MLACSSARARLEGLSSFLGKRIKGRATCTCLQICKRREQASRPLCKVQEPKFTACLPACMRRGPSLFSRMGAVRAQTRQAGPKLPSRQQYPEKSKSVQTQNQRFIQKKATSTGNEEKQSGIVQENFCAFSRPNYQSILVI